MRRSFLLLALAATALAPLGASCAMASSDCSSDGTCAGATPDGGLGGSSSGNLDATNGPDVHVPPNCKEDADSKAPEAAGCLADDYAVFVDGANGEDNAEGTKAKPMKSLAFALAKAKTTGRPRVYVCGVGPYAESVKLTQAVSIYGGFACGGGAWTPDATKARIAPPAGYALQVDGVSALVTLSDLDLVAPDVAPLKDGTSSIAVFANASNLKLVRSNLTGGVPAEGKPGAAGEVGTYVGGGSPDGNAGTGAGPGLPKSCTCSTDPIASTGGAGGSNGTGGAPGLPSYPGSAPKSGAAGDGSTGECISGSGHEGAEGPAGKNAATAQIRGALASDGWLPSGGVEGTESGHIGQGGGGGGATDGTAKAGSGGCGGCGGTPGRAGTGGGASIALVAVGGAISTIECTLVAHDGAKGGAGGPGGLGGAGGKFGIGSCGGGPGGKGGSGGGGSGGAGGLSVGILFQGTAPLLVDATTTMQTTVGAAGAGGTALGTNPGPAGLAAVQQDATKLTPGP